MSSSFHAKRARKQAARARREATHGGEQLVNLYEKRSPGWKRTLENNEAAAKRAAKRRKANPPPEPRWAKDAEGKDIRNRQLRKDGTDVPNRAQRRAMQRQGRAGGPGFTKPLKGRT